MSKIKTVYFLLAIISTSCGRTALNNSPHIDTLLVGFYPAFIASSKVTVIRLADSSIVELKRFSNDSARNIYHKSIKVSNQQTDTLCRVLNSYKFEKWDKPMLDGMTVYGKFKNETLHEFSLWESGGSEKEKLIGKIYLLLGDCFKEKKAMDYLKEIEEY